jgi:hypothetical protein
VVDSVSSQAGLSTEAIPEEEQPQKTQGTERMSAESTAASQLESRTADAAGFDTTPTEAASATARSEPIETLRQPISKSEIQLSKIPKWAIPLGGVIAVGLFAYLGYSFYENRCSTSTILAGQRQLFWPVGLNPS